MAHKNIEKKIEGIRDCLLNGHHWQARIDHFDGECMALDFECKSCGGKKTKWLHNKPFKSVKSILSNAVISENANIG